MSVKTETIEVRRCDFCINTSAAQACDNCGKDACADCGQNWTVKQESLPQKTFIPDVSFVMVDEGPSLMAFFCSDCVKGDAETAMLRLGFTRRHAEESVV